MDQRTITISVPPMFTTPTPTDAAGSASASATPPPTITNPSWFLDYAIYGPYSANASSPALPTGTDSSSSSSSSTPPPAGAIAGGVVGALVIVGIIVAAFLLWRRRKQQQITAASVKEGYPLDEADAVTAYTNAESLRPTLATTGTRRSSMHKGAASSTRQVSSGPLTGVDSDRTPLSPGPTASETINSNSGHADALSPGRTIQEVDGGVRLARGSDYSSGVVNVLPPRYAPYDDDE